MDKSFSGTKEEYLEFRKKKNKINKKYYSKPEVKEKKRIYNLKYKKENKEKIIEYGYKLRARPETQLRIEKWRKENKEHLKEYKKSGKYKKSKAISNKKYWEKNREKCRLYQIEYRKNNLDKINKYYKKYYNSKKGKLNWIKQNHLRISKKHGNEFNLTQEQIKQIFERDKVCVYCNKNNRLELDHIIPISKGGKSIFNNFVVACRYCNPSKSNKDVVEWCNLKNIKVPKIVIELLEKQGVRHSNFLPN